MASSSLSTPETHSIALPFAAASSSWVPTYTSSHAPFASAVKAAQGYNLKQA